VDTGGVADAVPHEVVVHQQGRLAGSGRAFERRRGDPDDDPAALEVGQDPAQGEGARLGVELVAPLDQPRRGLGVDVGAQRDHQDVAGERTGVRLHLPGRRVDGGHLRLHELHAGLGELPVGMVHGGVRRATEHDVELREPEHEPVTLVDQHDVDPVAELLGQPGGELEAPEPGAEDDHPHGRIVGRAADGAPAAGAPERPFRAHVG
jgi:hypothetical protein